ncbi:MAG: hypothetical protein HYT31_02900 [Parcubacteria group bacterium]|nr:hypothetical protein [Parcubacteria group bacterium]
MAQKIAVTGTSVTTLDRVNVSEDLEFLGRGDQSGAVPLIITAPRASLAAKLAPVRRRLLSRAGATFLVMTPTGLRVVARGESPAIDSMMPFVVHTNTFSFQWIYPGIPTKPGAGEAIPLDVVVCGTAQVASMPALLARTQQGLPYVLSGDWQAARDMLTSPFAEILGSRTYSEHRVLGLPGHAGVSRESQLASEIRDAMKGALAGLANEGNVFSFKDVTVDVRPPEHIRKREEAQEALVREISASIASEGRDKFWPIRGRVSESAQTGALDAENAARLIAAWEKRAEVHLTAAVKGTDDVAATREIVAAAAISRERKDELYHALDEREAELKEKQRANALTGLGRAIERADLGSVPSIGQQVRNDARITPDDRTELIAKLEEKRASLEAEEARLKKRTEDQRPKVQEFLDRIPGADREALTLIVLQVAREEFVRPLLKSLEEGIAQRDQELKDAVEAHAQAEVARRVSEVDIQARVVIVANTIPAVRARLNEAAGLINSESTRVQAAIALRAAGMSDRGIQDGFRLDAAALLGGEARPALERGKPAPESARLADTSGPGQDNGREAHPVRGRATRPKARE